MIPKVLSDVTDYLQGQNLTLPVTSTGARASSAEAESYIIRQIQNSHICKVTDLNIVGKNNTSWADVKIDDCFCDIKISTTRTADNTNAKKHVYYFLTGQDPDTNSVSSQESKIFKLMRENENVDENRDFYYLIVNKNNLDDIFVVSLKTIATLNPNPSNMPFQAKWRDCRVPVSRTWSEAREFLLGTWAESIKRKQKALAEGMPVAYPEFFE